MTIQATFPPLKARENTAIKRALANARRDRAAINRRFMERRRTLLSGLAGSLRCSTDVALLISADEGDVLHLRNLKAAKAVARKITRRACLLIPGFGSNDGSILEPTVEVQRPTRIVRERHRPVVFPGLVAENPDLAVMAIEEALIAARNWVAAGETGFRLLDRFRAVTGLDWHAASDWLYQNGIVPVQFNGDTIAMAAAARQFWIEWVLCRHAYRSAVRLGQIELAAGDWGLIEPEDIQSLLPEFSSPKSAMRAEWLIQMARRPHSFRLDLHFYAPSYAPLFTLPL